MAAGDYPSNGSKNLLILLVDVFYEVISGFIEFLAVFDVGNRKCKPDARSEFLEFDRLVGVVSFGAGMIPLGLNSYLFISFSCAFSLRCLANIPF